MNAGTRWAMLLFSGAGAVGTVGFLFVVFAFATLGPSSQTAADRWRSLHHAANTNPGFFLTVYLILNALLVLCVKAVAGHPKMYHQTGRHLLISSLLAGVVILLVMAASAFGLGPR